MIAHVISDKESATRAWELMRSSFTRRLPKIVYKVTASRQAADNQRQSLKNLAASDESLLIIAAEEVDHIDLLAQEYFTECSAIWTDVLGRPKSKAFYSAVFRHCLLPMFADRDHAFHQRLKMRFRVDSRAAKAVERHFANLMFALQRHWRNDLDSQAYDTLLKKKSERAWAIRTKGIKQRQQTSPERPLPRNAGKRCGRKRRLDPEFIKLAGNLWRAERIKCKPGNVKEEGLIRIAAQLDERGFKHPADFLEGDAGRELGAYNSQHSELATPPILTWTQLVRNPKAKWTDKRTGKKRSFRSAMRRLLSRCANSAET